jgi:hypothetical protein
MICCPISGLKSQVRRIIVCSREQSDRNDMKSIWAISRNFLVEVLRMRSLMVVIAGVVLLYTVVFAWWLHANEGRADEKVQTFLSYSLRGTSALFCLLAIFLATASITRDIKRREIFTIVTKPVSRGGYLLGKFLGLAIFNLIFLGVSGGLIYGLARVMERTEPSSDDERDRLSTLVFKARQAVGPEQKDITEDVRQAVDKLVAQQLQDHPSYKDSPQVVDQIRSAFTAEKTREFRDKQTAVAVGSQIVWHFSGIAPVGDKSGLIYIRYKQEVSSNPSDLTTTGEWLIGPEDPRLAGGLRFFSRDVIRTVHEFAVPVSSVSAAGDLYICYRNNLVNNGVTVIFPVDTGIEVLYAAGGFGVNFLRAMALIYVRLLFLCVLGMALGGWLSFPVAVLVIMVAYVLGVSSNFILDAMKWNSGPIHRQFVSMVMCLQPSFSGYDPIGIIEKGRIISFGMTGDLFSTSGPVLQAPSTKKMLIDGVVLVKDFVLFSFIGLFGYLLFKFRELARVIV